VATTEQVTTSGAAAAGAAERPRKPPSWKRWTRKETLAGYVFIAPALIHSLIFIVLVVIVSFIVSLHRWDLITPPEFVGFDNYVRLFQDELFYITLENTVIFVLMFMPATIILSLSLALAANTKIRGLTFFRTAYFFPYIASMVAVAIIFRWIYSPDFGLLNAFVGWFGVDPVTWLDTCQTALPAITLVSVWKGLGWNMTLFLAGLQGIPAHLYEAAQLDGAGKWRQFKDITWPLLSPTTFFVAVTSMLGSFQVFDTAYLMTQGGPQTCTYTYMYYVYQQAFRFYHMGYAAAMAWVLFVILAIVIFIQFKLLNKRVHYELG
jgi:multiple sugar transport system permease protein